ncbi:MAG: hypothetical protein ABEJ65_10505, partial [bacterium]
DTEVLNDTDSRTVQGAVKSLLLMNAEQFFDTQPPSEMNPPQARIQLETASGQTIDVVLGGTYENKRLVKRDGWPVVTVGKDPVRLFQDVPNLPGNWPEPIEKKQSAPKRSSGKLPANLKKRLGTQ